MDSCHQNYNVCGTQFQLFKRGNRKIYFSLTNLWLPSPSSSVPLAGADHCSQFPVHFQKESMLALTHRYKYCTPHSNSLYFLHSSLQIWWHTARTVLHFAFSHLKTVLEDSTQRSESLFLTSLYCPDAWIFHDQFSTTGHLWCFHSFVTTDATRDTCTFIRQHICGTYMEIRGGRTDRSGKSAVN